MTDADAATPQPGLFPRVPGYAWAWFQRSRPVVAEAAQRLTGGPPSAGFMEDLRALVGRDAFVQAVVADVVADVAFHGRVPQTRPLGASWDRGLTWWAAALAGVTPAEFESRSAVPAAEQVALFNGESDDAEAEAEIGDRGRSAETSAGPISSRARSQVAARVARTPERSALAAVLRDLLAAAEGGQVPASAVRQLLAQLEA